MPDQILACVRKMNVVIEALESRRLLSATPAVSSLTLINADTGKPVTGFDPIRNGAVIDLDALPTQHLNVRANPAGKVGSIKFGLDANSTYRIENTAPLALFSDGAKGYYAGTFALGTHTITATAYSAVNAKGTAATALTVHFQVTRHNKWIEGRALPVSMTENAGGIIGTTLYIVGEGASGTYAYDLINNTWRTLKTRPFVGDHHAAEVLNGTLYLFGGLDGGSEGKVQIYDPVKNTWTLGQPMPFAAGSCSSAVIGGMVYVAGGITGKTTTTDQVARYDPVANCWTMLAPMPFGLNHSASATDGNKLYVFGGRTGGNHVTNGYNIVEAYDPTTNSWDSTTLPGSTLAPLPQGRGGTGKAVFANGEFYVMGGETENGPGASSKFTYSRVDIYNPLTNTWRAGAPMPTARHGIFPLLYGNEIYVAGGGTHSGASYSNFLEIYQI